MDIRQYLNLFKRHKWFILESVIVVAVAAGILSSLRTPIYEGTAKVLLRPNDPSEQINPADVTRAVSNDPDRYVTAQEDIVRSPPVAAGAAKLLTKISPTQVTDGLSVSQDGQNDVLDISASDPDPVKARDIANAVANGYIENRRLSAVEGLQRATDEIEGKLGPLQARIADLDRQIGDSGATAGSTAGITTPTRSATGPAQPTAPITAGVDSGGQPTSSESLKAARYAAAVQYETLYSRQQELLVNISLKRGEAELISLAKTPTAPTSPQPKRDAALGGIVGLLLGLGISFLREQLDDRVHSTQEIEQLTDLPVLAQLPLDSESAKTPSHVGAVEAPLGSLSESVRSLRTSIQLLAIDEPIKVIVVTSAGPNEGKSLVAANLAAVYAQAGSKTCLVSGDLRRPTLQTMFPSISKRPGLTEAIAKLAEDDGHMAGNGNGLGNGSGLGNGVANGVSSSTPPAGVTPHSVALLVRTRLAGLVILPPGRKPPNPAELLGSQRMATLLGELRDSADVIIIDTPPILAVTDAAVLAARADGVVLVTTLNHTRRDAVTRAKAILDPVKTRMLGVIVNKASGAAGYYYYAGYYGDEYRADTNRRVRKRALAAVRGASGKSTTSVSSSPAE